MRYLLLVALAAFFMFGVEQSGAQAQTIKCDVREHVVAELKGGYAEKVAARGLGNDNAVMEIFASPDGTWTLIRTQLFPSGTKWSCIIYAGKAWSLAKPAKGTAL